MLFRVSKVLGTATSKSLANSEVWSNDLTYITLAPNCALNSAPNYALNCAPNYALNCASIYALNFATTTFPLKSTAVAPPGLILPTLVVHPRLLEVTLKLTA